MNLLTAVSSCATSSCATECNSTPAGSKGIGDTCVADADCHGSAVCFVATGESSGFCTASCSYTSDCYGYPNTYNQSGHLNACLSLGTGKGAACVPGCSTKADCTQYGSASTCQRLTNGVCACVP